MRPSQSSAFELTSIPDLAVWYRSDRGVTLSGSSVVAWADQSGNGRHVTQTTATRQPAFVASAYGGHPTLSFDGNDFLRSSGDVPLTRASTVLVVLGSITTRGYVVEHGTSTTRYYWSATGFNANSWEANTIWDRQNPPTTWAAANGRYVTRYQRGTAFPESWGNGSLLTMTTGGSHPAEVTRTERLTVGARFDDSTGHAGQISEVAIYNRALSGAEIARLHDYLKRRYG